MLKIDFLAIIRCEEEKFMKNPMNVENVLKFFENNYGAKFIDINTKKPVLEIIAKNKTEEKSEFDLWLEQQDEETQSAHKMGEI